ncbi:hypothetical protein HK100_004365 [Physocladia obscura]|uniref:Glycerol uptake facilitator protein n=1 Tax=Physocladia obscura TaxID=109957 RepID=A0AAD5SSZ9_9FUNG|nr:hypothetical protein HK100_004365 [Physocladia obscura]
MLRTRDQIDPQALRLASYSTKPIYMKKTSEKSNTFASRIADARYYLLNQSFDSNPNGVIEHLIGGTYALHGAEVPFPAGREGNSTESAPNEETHKLKKRHSIQVADMQRVLRKMEQELANEDNQVRFEANQTAPDITVESKSVGITQVNSREEALGRAAIAADQATKLSVFATRPAILLPIHNFFVEMIGTAFLVFGASMIEERLNMITDATARQADTIQIGPFLIGMYIMCLILGLGGPTGFAANPARDMAPRLAHFLLPIPGKGSSELTYGVIINVGAMFGGAIGGGLIIAAEKIILATS